MDSVLDDPSADSQWVEFDAVFSRQELRRMLPAETSMKGDRCTALLLAVSGLWIVKASLSTRSRASDTGRVRLIAIELGFATTVSRRNTDATVKGYDYVSPLCPVYCYNASLLSFGCGTAMSPLNVQRRSGAPSSSSGGSVPAAARSRRRLSSRFCVSDPLDLVVSLLDTPIHSMHGQWHPLALPSPMVGRGQ